MTINNKKDLTIAYLALQDYSETKETLQKYAYRVKELKKSIRDYYKKQNQPRPTPTVVSIIKEYGIDGYISLELLPAEITDIETGKEYFAEFGTYSPVYSQYDCTGKPFTIWFKVFKRNGRIYAYHSVRFDV